MSALRIGWAAPWSSTSAIAHSASEVAFELARRGHSVTVLRTETGEWLGRPARAAPGPIRHVWEYARLALESEFDVVVAHWGDHYGYHGALLSHLDELEFVGIFHDSNVSNLILGWIGDDARHLPRFDAIIRWFAGSAYGKATAAGSLRWDDPLHVARHHPAIEWIAKRAIGAVAHAEHYVQRLRTACPGPVGVMPLAFTVQNLPPPPAPSSRMTIGIIGHANANKRIDQIILAISASYLLRSRCFVRVIGEITDSERTKLTDLASAVGANPPEFTGWVSDEDLRIHLRDVDVMGCLRNPVLEGGSASLVVALRSGRPTLVTGHGSYAEVPPDAVLVCSPHHEAVDVMRHLEHVVEDPGFGIATGVRGHAFAAERHSAKSYVDKLVPLLELAIAARPKVMTERQLIGTLGEFGIPFDDPAVDRISNHLSEMLGSSR